MIFLTTLGEDVATAAVREVKEETGIDTKFECVLSIREHHGFRFGKYVENSSAIT